MYKNNKAYDIMQAKSLSLKNLFNTALVIQKNIVSDRFGLQHIKNTIFMIIILLIKYWKNTGVILKLVASFAC